MYSTGKVLDYGRRSQRFERLKMQLKVWSIEDEVKDLKCRRRCQKFGISRTRSIVWKIEDAAKGSKDRRRNQICGKVKRI